MTGVSEREGSAGVAGVTELLAEARERDVRLWVQDGRLRFDAPPGALDDDLRARLRHRRDQLIAVLDRGRRRRPPVTPVPRTGPLPLSYGQQRMWMLAEILPPSGAAAYVLSGAARLTGPLDAAALRRALSEVVRRHEALRTVVRLRDGVPTAVVLPAAPVELVLHDLGRTGEPERSERVHALAAEAARRPFELATGPLLRSALVLAGPREAFLLLSLHHSCADAWSLGVLFRELAAAYQAFSAGAEPRLPELPVQYPDFAAWQRRHLTPEALAEDVDYWRGQLAGVPALLELPTDRPRPPVQSYRGAVQRFRFDRELADGVWRLAREAGATPFMVLLAAWVVVLSRLADSTDVPVGTPVAGRHSPEVEPLIGFLVNTLVLRVDAGGDPTFRELLDRVRAVTLAGLAHQEMPFEQLVELLQPERALSHSPLFQHMFILQNASGETLTLPGLSVALEEVHTGTAKFDLTLLAEEDAGGLRGSLEYATDLFDAGTARRHLEHWQSVLSAAVADPGTRVSRLPLLPAGQREQLLTGFNDTAVDVPPVTLDDLLRAQVARTPDRTALVSGESRLSYAELDAAVQATARGLRRRGVAPGVLVGLALPRCTELVVALLAVLRAGGAYLPLDLAAPADRNAGILADAGAPWLLTAAGRPPALPVPDGTRLLPFGQLDGSAADPPVERPAGPADPAYVIYTSGSTGRPKGVVVEHRNVVNFCAGMDALLPQERAGRWLALTTASFDISVLELVWTLTRGLTVVLQPAPGAGGPRGGRTAELSLFYFSSAAGTEGSSAPGAYRLLLAGARFADRSGFSAVWTPERHFHAFGGLFPNPSLTAAAVAAVTERVGVRAGSVVLPLHDPVRVAEEWAVVDNLSGGRVGISFASGWQADDFVLAPDRYDDRKQVLLDGIETVRALWRGGTVERPNGRGRPTAVRTLPRPVQPELPVWVTAAGSPATFRAAGSSGANLLTHLLGQDLDQLAEKIGLYRTARAAAGHPGPGTVTLMLHTFVGDDPDAVRATVRGPFRGYLASSLDLIGNLARTLGLGDDVSRLDPADLDALLEHAVDRYYGTAGLFGTPEQCAAMLDRVVATGVDEVACLIDFGVPEDLVLGSLPLLARARDLHASGAVRAPAEEDVPVPELIARHGVTALQCTPSQAAMILLQPGGEQALARLRLLLVGGEELPPALAGRLCAVVPGQVRNMYGPTETTIWSTSHRVDPGGEPLLGRPIANTTVYVLDRHGEPVPVGVPGELHIGGAGVARGYLGRPELTAERFGPDPFGRRPGARTYRTGDLVRWRPGGELEFLGRTDHQVKVRGHRVELGEVEVTLAAHEQVAQAAASTVGAGAERRLAAYAVPVPGATPDPGQLRRFLAARLPAYMVPAHLQLLDRLPYTPNGKVDRRALPRPEGGTGAAAVEPRDTLEMQLAALWAEVLEVRRVGVHDDFFDLGGHSVLAVTLLARVERRFGRRLPLASLFGAPTVAEMARLLRQDSATTRSVVVPLRPDGDVPLVILPGAGGNLVYLHQLVAHLPAGISVHGLQPVFAEGTPARLETLVEDMAEQYLPALRELQPAGPYHLVGHSFGGYVAFELAQRLRAAGAEVGLLGILDTAAPLPGRPPLGPDWDSAVWIETVGRMFERLFGRPIGLRAADLAGLDERGQVAALRTRLGELDLLPPEVDQTQFEGFVRTYRADQQSVYVPAERYDGPLVFFRAERLHPDSQPAPELAWTLADPARAWGRFCARPVQVHEIPGDHLSALTRPHVATLAELLGGALLGRPAGVR
ncbi:MAG: MupA/Atu3671 family FMN-dependent luciferase-like monooxygenase [Mycobacteriales bacterium]